MALSTIGFGDLIPGLRGESAATLWFCSIYIMSGMALTAMCFNVLHDEIMCRIKYIIDANQKTHSMSYDNVLNQSLNGTTKSKLINESNAHNVTNGDYSNS
jgi:Ion channel